MPGVPEALTWPIRSVHSAWSPIFAPVHSSAAGGHPVGLVEHQLQTHRAADRDAGVEERATDIAAFEQHVVDHRAGRPRRARPS